VSLTESSVVRLHRIHVSKRGDSYFVTRWGGKSMISTHASGIAAIRLLHRRSLHEVGRLLQVKNELSAAPSLLRLVRVLADANLVRTVDGVRVSSREITPTTFARFIYKQYVRIVLERVAYVALPISWIAGALFWIRYAGNRKRIGAQLRTSDANIAGIFEDYATSAVHNIQKEHRRYLRRTKLDPEFLLQRSEKRIDSWLGAHIKCTGADRLKNIATNGAVVAVPHFHRFALAPLVLMKAGFNVCLIGTTSLSVSRVQLQSWYRRFSELPGHGSLELLPNFNLKSIRQATELLHQGYIVVSHPDAALRMFADESAQRRMRFFGMDYSGLPPASIRVTVRGSELQVGLFLFWLAAYSGCPCVPVVSLPAGHDSELRIEDPIEVETGVSTSRRAVALAHNFYALWEQHIVAIPGQWFGWHLLHQWQVTSGTDSLGRK